MGSRQSLERVSSKDLAMHRFIDFAVDIKTKEKQLKVLKPNTNQVLKQSA